MKDKIALCLLILMVNGCGSSNDKVEPRNNNLANSQVVEEENSDENSSDIAEEDKVKLVSIASSNQAYLDLNLKKEKVEIWEDGMRTNGGYGSYEWWYSDFIFTDGTTVAVTFYSKFLFNTYGPPLPMVTLNIVYPDGRRVNDADITFGQKLNASKTSADVHIKSSYLTYDDGNYKLHYSKGDITFDATMVSNLPMWRPETGHIYFGETNYFAWLPAQPSSTVNATLQENGEKKELIGAGYHDHNWGNSPIHENINNWYWGRATVGEYSLIFSDIIAQEEYGYERVPIMMVAKGNEILELNGSIEIERKDLITDKNTEKSYADKLRFVQKETNGRTYTIETSKKSDIAFVDMNIVPYDAGENPTYLRSTADITLTVTEKNGTKKSYKGMGIIEQMSFNDNVENNPKVK